MKFLVYSLFIKSYEDLTTSPTEFEEWELLNDQSLEISGHCTINFTVLAQDAVDQWRNLDVKLFYPFDPFVQNLAIWLWVLIVKVPGFVLEMRKSYGLNRGNELCLAITV